MYTIRMLYQKINGFFLRSWYNGPGPLYLRTNRVMCPWAWRNWLSVGSTSSRFAAPPILPPHLWYNAPRAFIFEDKRCEESLGLEKLAVGRSDLRPLRGTANSPSHLRGILAQGLYA